MDGSNALIYARIRHDNSDFQRMRRQQQVLFAIRDRLLSPEALPQLPALAHVLAECDAFDKLSGDERSVFGAADFVDSEDVRMI